MLWLTLTASIIPNAKNVCYFKKRHVSEHSANSFGIFALIEKIQFPWQISLRFFSQPQQLKLRKQPRNDTHQHLKHTLQEKHSDSCLFYSQKYPIVKFLQNPQKRTSIVAISTKLWGLTLGCWTLTATNCPVAFNLALWTCAKEAAPRGRSSNSSNNSDIWK